MAIGKPPAAQSRHRRGSKVHRKPPTTQHHPPAQGLANDITLFVNPGTGRGEPLPKAILNDLIQVEVERSIESGSTIKLKTLDPNRNLQRAGYFTRKGKEGEFRAEFELDELWFTCVHFEKSVDEFTLTAEDREISKMRDFKGPLSMSAAQGTKNPRAVWIQTLCRKSGLHLPHQFFCPEIGKKPPVLAPIETAAQKKKSKTRGGPHQMAIGGSVLNPDQRHNVEILMEVCDEKHAPTLARVAILCAAIGESTLQTLTTPNSLGYWGVLQGGSGQKGSAPNFPNTPNPQVTKEMAQSFLDGGRGFQAGGALALIRGGEKDPGTIATKVEASGEPSSFYGKNKVDAEALVSAAGTGEPSGSGTAEGASYTPQRMFKLPQNEKSEAEEPEGGWENAEAYGTEVNWRLFCVAGIVHYVSDEYLERMTPWVEGLDETTDGIVDIKWQIDSRKNVNPAVLELEARAPLWSPPPGVPIILGERNGTELHEGVWLVSTIKRPDWQDNAITVTLTRPKQPLPERSLAKKPIVTSTSPESPNGTTTRDGGHNPGATQPTTAEGVPAEAFNVFFNAKYIDSKHLPYVWGGGHGSTFGPTNQQGAQLGLTPILGLPDGLDCSGAVSYALGGGAANLLSAPTDVAGLKKWGAHGTGKFFTVWCRGANEHTFLEFTAATTGTHSVVFVAHKPGTIVGFGSESHEGSDWEPRHWPGL